MLSPRLIKWIALEMQDGREKSAKSSPSVAPGRRFPTAYETDMHVAHCRSSVCSLTDLVWIA